MEIRELVTFLSLAKTLNYQKSAAELQYAPSTLKKHISNLEVELRVPLFEKKGRGIQMTQEGSRFIEYAQDLVSNYNKAVEHLSLKNGTAKPLVIAGCEANLICEMGESLRAYRAQFPDKPILETMSSNSAVPKLVKIGEGDLGIHYTVDSKPIAGLESIALYREQLCWMAALGNPLLEKSEVTYEDFFDQQLVTQHVDCCFINDALEKIRQKGVDSIKILSLFFSNLQTIGRDIYNTKSICLLPYSFANHPPYGTWRPLNMAEPSCWVWNRIVGKTDTLHSEQSQAFIYFFQEYAKQKISAEPFFYKHFYE